MCVCEREGMRAGQFRVRVWEYVCVQVGSVRVCGSAYAFCGCEFCGCVLESLQGISLCVCECVCVCVCVCVEGVCVQISSEW